MNAKQKKEIETMLQKLSDAGDALYETREAMGLFEPDESDYEESYRDMIDGAYGEFMGMWASRILETCDPIAYSCGLSDYVNSLDSYDDDPDYQVLIVEEQDGVENFETIVHEINDYMKDNEFTDEDIEEVDEQIESLEREAEYH